MIFGMAVILPVMLAMKRRKIIRRLSVMSVICREMALVWRLQFLAIYPTPGISFPFSVSSRLEEASPGIVPLLVPILGIGAMTSLSLRCCHFPMSGLVGSYALNQP